MRRLCLAIAALILSVSCVMRSQADNILGRDLSKYGLPIIAVGVLANGLSSDGKKQKEIVKAAEAAAIAGAITEVLKKGCDEKRPNGGNCSFPSGHTSCAFALGTVMAESHPRQKWLWYTLAAAIGWSRVDLRAHHGYDVLAGAALGYEVAHQVDRYNDRHFGLPGVALFQKTF